MSNVCGGVNPDIKPADEKVHAICHEIKEHAEGKLGRKFEKFEPVHYKTQLVNGINYFIKVQVDNDEHVHVRAHQSFQGVTTFSNVHDKKSAADEISYF